MGLLRVKIGCQSLLSFEQLPNYMIVHFAFAVEVSIVCADAMNNLEVNYLAAPFPVPYTSHVSCISGSVRPGF